MPGELGIEPSGLSSEVEEAIEQVGLTKGTLLHVCDQDGRLEDDLLDEDQRACDPQGRGTMS